LKSELPSLIENQVGEHMQKLESRLVSDFREMGQRVIEESTAVLSEQLNERIQSLEEMSALQSQTLSRIRDSSEIADKKVDFVVNQLERTLAAAVPGFQLAPASPSPAMPLHPQFHLESPNGVIRSEARDISKFAGKFGFCPNCTSVDVRRANRKGVFEEFLRLFFIAPFRCRACRHKFYRF
jgi:hypothetical protein